VKRERRSWVRLRYAIAATLPLLITACSMVGKSYVEQLRLESIVGPELLRVVETKRSDLVRTQVKDALKSLQITLTSSVVRQESALEDWFLYLDSAALAQLNSNLPESGKEYVRGFVRVEGGKAIQAKLRYRGDNSWHWFYPQKSWRIKTPEDDLIHRARYINLLNPKSQSMLENYLATKLGEAVGLLTPRYDFVRLFVNNEYHGVYEWVDQVDEGLLRLRSRLPGNLYFGEGGPVMWDGAGEGWAKEAVYNQRPPEDKSDIQKLTQVVKEGGPDFPRRFAEIANAEKFLAFQALLELTASHHVDQSHNHKIYFDPSSGKAEPIPWDLFGHGTQAESVIRSLGAVYNPITGRLLEIPRWSDQKNKILWALLNGAGSVSAQHALVDQVVAKMRPDVYADRLKDYPDYLVQGLPSRPFSNRDFETAVQAVKDWIALRDAALRSQLTQNRLFLQLQTPRTTERAKVYPLQIVGDGWVGTKLSRIEFKFTQASLKEGRIELWEDRNGDGMLDDGDRRILVQDVGSDTAGFDVVLDQVFYPGRTGGLRQDDFRYRLDPTPLHYPHLLVARGEMPPVQMVRAHATNSVTGEMSDVVFGPAPVTHKPVQSLHPWAEAEGPPLENLVLGPGEVVLERDLLVYSGTSLTVRPGTILKMGPGASIFAFGSVFINGAPDRPVVITARDPHNPWGVLALQGEGARGSRIRHALMERGSEAEYGLVHYSGMLSVYNASIDIEGLIMQDNFGEDGINAKHSPVKIAFSRFQRLVGDAIDLDYSDGVVANSYFADIGNDAVDLMGSAPLIRDLLVERAGDKGVSVGEASSPVIFNVAIVDSEIGIQSKDGSTPLILNSVLTGNNLGIDLYQKNLRYGEGGQGTLVNSLIFMNRRADYVLDKRSRLLVLNSTVGRVEEERAGQIEFVNAVSTDLAPTSLRHAGWMVTPDSPMNALLTLGDAMPIRKALPSISVGQRAPVGLFRPLHGIAGERP
jgi:hypothetical protein